MKLLGELTFYTLLILLPVNLGQHFFSNAAYIHGVLVDYHLPTVYLTDLLVLFILCTWLTEINLANLKYQISNIKDTYQRLKKFESSSALYLYIFISLFLFLLWSGLSILWAPLKDVAFYRYARLLEGALLAFWVGTHVNLRRDFGKCCSALFLGVSYESVIAVGQWFKGGSLFGYHFLGEQPYNVLTPGIAKTGFLGEVRVRAYGTFTHPNVLGGYLALFLPWLSWRLISKRFNLTLTGMLLLALLALFFTFSRAAWLAAAVGLISSSLILRRERLRLTGKVWLGITGGLFLLAGFYFSGTFNDPFSLTRRAELNSLALKMVQQSPWLGVGWGNFMVKLEDFGRVSGWTRFVQPVHNVFLLILAETGLFGLTFWLLFLLFSLFWLFHLWNSSRFKKPSTAAIGPASATLQLLLSQNGQDTYRFAGLLLVGFGQVIFLNLADHYFLTLPQGSLLFWLLFGLVFSLTSA